MGYASLALGLIAAVAVASPPVRYPAGTPVAPQAVALRRERVRFAASPAKTRSGRLGRCFRVHQRRRVRAPEDRTIFETLYLVRQSNHSSGGLVQVKTVRKAVIDGMKK